MNLATFWSSARARLVASLPWLATAVSLAISLAFVPWSNVIAELGRRPCPTTVSLGFALPFVVLFVIGACDHLILRNAATRPVSYEDVLRARAATSAVPFGGASSASYFLWIKRVVFPRSTLVTIGCLGFGEIGALCLVTLMALATAALVGLPMPYEKVAVICAAVSVVLLGGVLAARRARGGSVASTMRVIPSKVLLGSLLGHSAKVAVFVIATWAAARSFGLALPLVAVAVYVPLIMLAGFLPLSVAGFGLTQVGWLLFVDFAPAEQLLAFQLVWNVAQHVGRSACGLPFMSRVHLQIVTAQRLAAASS